VIGLPRYNTGGIVKSRLLRLLIYVIVAGAVSLAALEVGLRLYVKAPVLTFRDWRGANSMALESGGKYDEVLGWVQPAYLASDGFNTVEYGIRKNSSRDEPLSRGAVLAVGDSYTVGSEVRDDESWPAQLERLAQVRVINAGVGGYGLDQIVLAAERLLPVMRRRRSSCSIPDIPTYECILALITLRMFCAALETWAMGSWTSASPFPKSYSSPLRS
jgi:hypothetical protein